jgi:hypothetical protein
MVSLRPNLSESPEGMFPGRCPTDRVRGGELFKRVVISALSERTEPSSEPRAGRLHRSGHLDLLTGLHHRNGFIIYRGRAAPRSDRRHTCSLFGYGFGMFASGHQMPHRTARGAAALPPTTDPKGDDRCGRDGPEGDIAERSNSTLLTTYSATFRRRHKSASEKRIRRRICRGATHGD